MRNVFVDRIVELRPFKTIRGVKAVSCQEDYLADHFEGFPVLPGTLMIQGGLELAEWLFRASKEFPRSDFQATRVSRVRYLQMVRPGDRLETEVEVLRWDGGLAECKVKGTVGTKKVFTARLTLRERPCPVGAGEPWTEWDRAVLGRQKANFAALMGECAAGAPSEAPLPLQE